MHNCYNDVLNDEMLNDDYIYAQLRFGILPQTVETAFTQPRGRTDSVSCLIRMRLRIK